MYGVRFICCVLVTWLACVRCFAGGAETPPPSNCTWIIAECTGWVGDLVENPNETDNDKKTILLFRILDAYPTCNLNTLAVAVTFINDDWTRRLCGDPSSQVVGPVAADELEKFHNLFGRPAVRHLVTPGDVRVRNRFAMRISGQWLAPSGLGKHALIEPDFMAPTVDRRLSKGSTIPLTASMTVSGVVQAIDLRFCGDYLDWLGKQGFEYDPIVNPFAPKDPRHLHVSGTSPTALYVVELRRRVTRFVDDRKTFGLAVLSRVDVVGNSGFQLAEIALKGRLYWRYPLVIGAQSTVGVTVKQLLKILGVMKEAVKRADRCVEPNVETAMVILCGNFRLEDWKWAAPVMPMLSLKSQDILVSAWSQRFRHVSMRAYMLYIPVPNPSIEHLLPPHNSKQVRLLDNEVRTVIREVAEYVPELHP